MLTLDPAFFNGYLDPAQRIRSDTLEDPPCLA